MAKGHLLAAMCSPVSNSWRRRLLGVGRSHGAALHMCGTPRWRRRCVSTWRRWASGPWTRWWGAPTCWSPTQVGGVGERVDSCGQGQHEGRAQVHHGICAMSLHSKCTQITWAQSHFAPLSPFNFTTARAHAVQPQAVGHRPLEAPHTRGHPAPPRRPALRHQAGAAGRLVPSAAARSPSRCILA